MWERVYENLLAWGGALGWGAEHRGLLQVARQGPLHYLEELVQLPRSLVVDGFLRTHMLVAGDAVALRPEYLPGYLRGLVTGEENDYRRHVDRIHRGALGLS